MRLKNRIITAFLSVCSAALVGGVVTLPKARAKAEEAATYLAYGSEWKYACGYVDGFYRFGVDSTVSTDGLATGKAPIGYANYDQYDFTTGTELTTDAEKRQLQYVFTTNFTVTEAKNALCFDLLYDDAIAVYLDGEEIYRDNIVGYNFECVEENDSVGAAMGAAKEKRFYLSLGEGALQATESHVLTAIVLQDFKNGNDAYFDMKVSGVNDFTPVEDDMPDTVALTYYEDPFTTRGVTFYTGLSLKNADVKYREVGAQEWAYENTEGEPWYGRIAHKVALTDLKEETAYEYAIGNKLLDVWGETYHFETASSEKVMEEFKFYYLTDTQSSDGWGFSIWKKLTEYIEANGETFDFFAHGGDIVESSTTEKGLVPEQWQIGFNAVEDTMTSLPIVPVSGNHEYAAYAFYKHFNIKYTDFNDAGAYYSFDYGNAHITVLNTNDSYFNNWDTKGEDDSWEDQVAWVENDLASTNKTWKIVLMHFAAINDNKEDTAEYKNVTRPVQEAMMPIYAKTGVDLVLSGHTHRYFRSAIYAHGDSVKGADMAETLQNVRDSVIPETDVVTYVDPLDGTYWTVEPKGTMYVTAKSTNYNVYYQNFAWNQEASLPTVFATNPLNGKVMNGGTEADDTSYLMNKLQYVSVEVKKDTLRCNVYNVDAKTGETVLWDTYNVIKANAASLDARITALPEASGVKNTHLSELLTVYGLHGALGDEGLSAANVTKIASLKSLISVADAKTALVLNSRIAELTVNDVEEFLACDQTYKGLSQTIQALVDVTQMEKLRSEINAAVKDLDDKKAANAVKTALEAADKINIHNLKQSDIDAVETQYNALTDDQKALVTNQGVIAALKAKLKAVVVIDMIEAIKIAPNKVEADKAYEAYSALTAEEKVQVSNYDILEAIRKDFAAQSSANANGSTGSSDGCGSSVSGLVGVGALMLAAAAVVCKRREK